LAVYQELLTGSKRWRIEKIIQKLMGAELTDY
jgi:hypothetical protein